MLICKVFNSHTLKNVSNTWELEFAKRIIDKKVLNPPLSTAGPIFLSDFSALSLRVPEYGKNGLEFLLATLVT